MRNLKLKFLFAFLLGLGVSGIVNAQIVDKANPVAGAYVVDSSSIRPYGPGGPYIIIYPPTPNFDSPANWFLNQEYSSFEDMKINDPSLDMPSHTGFRPLIGPQLISNSYSDKYPNYDSINNIGKYRRSWLYRKVYQENLFIIHDSASKFYATIDPLFNFQASMDRDSNKKYTQNTRGILIQGNVGDKFAFASIFWENQASLPYYLNQFVQKNYVVPGYGRPKSFGANSYDFSMAESYLTYKFSKHFSIQGGYGKNFIGDGYRSLLLSDNTFAYPYLRFTTTIGKHLQYTNLYTLFEDPFTNYALTVGNVEGLIQQKAGAFQYLSWLVYPNIEWGFFQGMIWTAGDQFNHTAFNINYFDPVIGANALTYGLGNNNNVLLGSTIKYKCWITRKSALIGYGQFVADDFPQNADLHSFYNQTGYQLGLKYLNKYCLVQLEYNQVRPYTYSSSDSLQNYSHYDQSLADPLGANFKELIGIINLHYKHFSIHLQGNYALEGLDSAKTNYGNNIFLPSDKATLTSTNVAMLQGVRSTLNYMDVHVSYLMNPRTNMNFTIGVSRRTLTNSLNNEPNMTLIYVGFRTSIENMYTDF